MFTHCYDYKHILPVECSQGMQSGLPFHTHVTRSSCLPPPPPPQPNSLTPSTTPGKDCPSRWLCSRGSDGEGTAVKWQLKSSLPSVTPPKHTHRHTLYPLPSSLPQRYPIHPVATPLWEASAPSTLFFPLVSARSLTQSISTTRSQSWI